MDAEGWAWLSDAVLGAPRPGGLPDLAADVGLADAWGAVRGAVARVAAAMGVGEGGDARDGGSAPQPEAEPCARAVDDFDAAFEANGGAECVVRIKTVGDAALAELKEPRGAPRTDNARVVLDDALRRLDCAVRSTVSAEHPAIAEAAAAASAVIDGAKENRVPGDAAAARDAARGLVRDAGKLLAVLASKVCAAALCCVDGAAGEWCDRVEELAEIATVGIAQLRAVAFMFAAAVTRMRSVGTSAGRSVDFADKSKWPTDVRKIGDAAIGHVVYCIALAVAAFQIEAVQCACP